MNLTNITGPTQPSMLTPSVWSCLLPYNGLRIKMGIDIEEITAFINFIRKY
jgi:hypothetical protein